MEYGFRAVIAPSFADIFFNNSFKNGLLPLVLDAALVDALFARTQGAETYALTIDLDAQTLLGEDGWSAGFSIDPFRKTCLLEGLDEIGLTLKEADAIRAYESRRRADAPWLFRE